jgi:hypothetical protein
MISPAAVQILPATTPAQWRLFERIPEILHRQESAFVPPFPGSTAKYLRPDSAFHRRHGTIVPYIAWRGEQPVGRIAAIINRTHNAYHHDEIGFFGFFACEKNPATAAQLFELVRARLRIEGLRTLRGPYHPSINDESGLLTEGAEQANFLGLVWNPAYYAWLVEGEGFKPVHRLYGFDLPLHRLPLPPRLLKISQRAAQRGSFRLRPMNLRQLESELTLVREVYNSTLQNNWGFLPIEPEELTEAAADLRFFADPGMMLIAEAAAEPVGVALSLPNLNELLALTKRTPAALRAAHLLLLLKTRRIRTGRQVIYGIVPAHRDRGGLHGWLLLEQFREAKARFRDAQLGWIDENNTEILAHAEMVGATRSRTWTLYEQPIHANLRAAK